MAGDWIKMRMDLPDDPAVIGIAEATGLDEDTVVGKLHKIWSWANRQTIDGNAPTVTGKWVDRYVGIPGFVDAMVKVGWLSTTAGGIALPDFDKHNSETAKQRALTSRRVARHRNAPSVSPSVTKLLPEKRREEKSKTPLNPPRGKSPEEQAFNEWWSVWPSGKKIGKQAAWKAYKAAVKRICTDRDCGPDGGHRHLQERLIAFVGTPKCLGPYCPHPSTWLNEGRYDDDPSAWQDSGRAERGPGQSSQSSSPLPDVTGRRP